MAEPLSEAAFAVLMERAGLSDQLPPGEREEIRAATRFAAAMAARVRAAAPSLVPETEPATAFAPWEPGA